jgi:hypothetical protein
MHIPKACGTSLAAGLRAAISPEIAIAGFDRVLFGSFADFHTLGAAERALVFDRADALPRQAALVAGHFACSTLRTAFPDGQLIAVLREPVTRLMSLWMFWRRHTDAHLEGWGSWGAYVRKARLPLAVFLADPDLAAQTDNVATRMLLWPHDRIPADGFIDPAHDASLLRLARRRLDDFAFTGIAESPGVWESLAIWLGRELTMPRMNEAGSIPAGLQVPLADELDGRCLALLESRSRLDLALWEWVATASGCAAEDARRLALLQHVARYAALMAAA